jgi:peptide/bleomycin uptake transporter
MFKSFFPDPRPFFLSAVVWSLFCILLWYFSANDWGQYIGLTNPLADAPPIIGPEVFVSKQFLWFYIYFAAMALVFATIWWRLSPNKWFAWSVLGSALIIFVTYFQVQVSVAINAWYGPFYDMIQKALSKPNAVSLSEFFGHMMTFAGLAFVAVFVAVANRFFVVHYIFRWRTAMNDYYVSHWQKLRKIEGASQRVQDDTMRFARSSEDIGVELIDSVMTLIAFLPILHALEPSIKEVPVLGAIPYPLVTISLVWAMFGTGLVALCAAKLPGLNFKNQRVEAAYRKELVFGEENGERADPISLGELFRNVRKNYFRMYFHQIYFNLGRVSFLQANNIIAYIILAPTIVAGAITLGTMERILNAFGRVRDSFNFLINSWYPIVELISIHKRLMNFEAAIHGDADQIAAADEAYGAATTVG